MAMLQEAAYMVSSGSSQREACRVFQCSRTQLRRFIAGEIDEWNVGKAGRRRRLSEAEERILADAAREFAQRGTPLSRQCLADMVREFMLSLPVARQLEVGFKDNRPGKDWLKSFCERYSFNVRRGQPLEEARAEAMDPARLAAHFARLRALCTKYNISSPAHVFNVDETGVSTRECSGSRVKVVTPAGARANSKTLGWSSNAYRITIMPVVSGDGKCWSPVVVVPGRRPPYRKKRGSDIYETLEAYLPTNSYVFARDPPGVDSGIFAEWARRFVRETEHLRRAPGTYLLLTLDGYSGHVQFEALQVLKKKNVIVVALPAHTSHRTQVLDVSCFGPFKTEVRAELHKRSVQTAHTKRTTPQRNDIFTLAELCTRAYHSAMTMANIISGFEKTGVWRNGGPDHTVINAADFTSGAAAEANERAARGEGLEAISDYHELVDRFSRRSQIFTSDGAVVEGGRLKVTTASGAMLTSDNVTSALRARREEKEKAQREKDERVQRAEKRRGEVASENERRKRKRIEKRRLREEAEQAHEEAELSRLAAGRAGRRVILEATRADRRQRAKERAATVG